EWRPPAPEKRVLAGLAVSWNDRRSLERLHPLEQCDPIASVRILVGQDREETVFDQVAGEEHSLAREEDELIAPRMRRGVVAELHRHAPEVDLCLVAVVDGLRTREPDPREQLGDL